MGAGELQLVRDVALRGSSLSRGFLRRARTCDYARVRGSTRDLLGRRDVLQGRDDVKALDALQTLKAQSQLPT